MNSKNDKNLKANDMRKSVKILGILLIVLIAAAVTITGCHNARHNKRMIQGRTIGMNHTGRFRQQMPVQNIRRDNRQALRPRMGQVEGNGIRQGVGRGRGRGRGMGQGMDMGPGMRGGGWSGPGMNNGINNRREPAQGMMNNNRPGAGNGIVNSPMQMNPALESQAGPAGIFIDRIPDVTEKQKKEYTDLLQKQKDEMVKMRAEMAAKIKSTLESQRSKMLNLFTSEQKKYIGAK
jgi:hypothetical protein